jgi:hypothetical protein
MNGRASRERFLRIVRKLHYQVKSDLGRKLAMLLILLIPWIWLGYKMTSPNLNSFNIFGIILANYRVFLVNIFIMKENR